MKKLFLLALLIFAPFHKTFSMKIIQELGCNALLFVGASVTQDVVHELGHIALYKLFYNLKYNYVKFSLNPFSGGHAVQLFMPSENEKGIKPALIYLAGPLAGITAGYALIKTAFIFDEFIKTKNIQQALCNGWNRPVFSRNSYTSSYAKTLLFSVYLGITTQILNLIPLTLTCDGRKAMEALGYFQNTQF